MTATASLHELIDATGGGCCWLRADGTIDSASPGFAALVGARNELAGLHPHAVLAELPALAHLPTSISAEAPIFRQVGSDGLGRELAAALVRDRSGESGAMLLLVDRSGEARLRRSQARLGRQIEDLKAELAARDQEPHRPRIRSMSEVIRRLDESLARAHRYGHAVTIVAVQIETEAEPIADREKLVGDRLLGCVRGVDDLGRVEANDWVVALPHTPLAGGEVVAKRIQERLSELGLTRVGVGVAQVGLDEPGAVAVERAEQAAAQAMESGGGLLLAVSLT
jgi:hypothetical protein